MFYVNPFYYKSAAAETPAGAEKRDGNRHMNAFTNRFIRWTLLGGLLAAVTLFLPQPLNADTITLKNGKVVRGRVIREENDTVTVQTSAMTITLPLANIESMEREANMSREEVLGDIAFDDKQYDEALRYYNLAMEATENKEMLKEKIANLLEIQQQEVERRFGRNLQEAERLMDAGDLDRAEEVLRNILPNVPSETLSRPVKQRLASVYVKRALAFRNTVDDIKAVECLKKAIEISGDSYQAHLMYAEYLARNARTVDEALDQYLQGIETGRRFMTKEELAGYHRQIALIYENKSLYKEANDQHKLVLDYDPITYSDTKNRMVENNIRIAMNADGGDFETRRGILEQTVILDPYSVKAYFALAFLNYENGYLDEALKQYDKIVTLNVRMPEVHYYIAMCHLKKRDFEKARDALERELAINPQNYDALCAMGDYYLTGGKSDQAVENFEKARNLRSEKYRAYIGLARALRRMEKPRQARENLDKIFLTNPDHIEATLLSGALFKDDKNYEKARELFDSVVSRIKEHGDLRNPDNLALLVEALNQRGELSLILDSPRIAITDFQESLQYQPDLAETYYLMAQVYIKMKRFEDAETNYFKAQELEPSNPKYYLGIGILYHQNLKQTQKAVEYYSKYIRLGGEDSENVNEWIRECGGQPVTRD